MIHMTDDNEEAKYLLNVERIHSCHNISKKKKIFQEIYIL